MNWRNNAEEKKKLDPTIWWWWTKGVLAVGLDSLLNHSFFSQSSRGFDFYKFHHDFIASSVSIRVAIASTIYYSIELLVYLSVSNLVVICLSKSYPHNIRIFARCQEYFARNVGGISWPIHGICHNVYNGKFTSIFLFYHCTSVSSNFYSFLNLTELKYEFIMQTFVLCKSIKNIPRIFLHNAKYYIFG